MPRGIPNVKEAKPADTKKQLRAVVNAIKACGGAAEVRKHLNLIETIKKIS